MNLGGSFIAADRSGLTDLAGYAALDQKANDAADKVGATGCNDQSGQ